MQNSSFPAAISNVRPVVHAFDEAVRAAREAARDPLEQERARGFVLEALTLFCKTHDEQPPEDRLRMLLDGDCQVQLRGTLAACLARLLSESPTEFLSEQEWRPAVVRFLDSQLGEIYPTDVAGAQGHEKLARLATMQRAAEDELRRASANLTSLERLGACRQTIMACLNKRANKAFLRPFLPESLDSRVGELATQLTSYLEHRVDVGIVEEIRSITTELDDLQKELTEYGTEYADVVLSTFVRPLALLASKEFQQNRAVKPANLRLTLTDKTFPLHLKISHFLEVPVVIRNDGPGYAEDASLMSVVNGPASTTNGETFIGRLEPLTERRIEIRVDLSQPVPSVQALFQLVWKNFDGAIQQVEATAELKGQRSGTDWQAARHSAPYSLEPVESATELVGRQDVLNRLLRLVQANSVGSAIVYGQKRVGKTSIAKALRSRAEAIGCTVLYLEGGEYIDPTADGTISQLGLRIARLLRAKLPAAHSLALPKFDKSLAPLVDFVEDAFAAQGSDQRLLLVLDEFDELPPALYDRSPTGNAFFLALRSITSRPHLGIVLVGGEKMRHLMDRQGDKLNKWLFGPVDYFSKERDWADYRELVVRPTAGVLDFTDSAVEALYDVTAGNPYFTHLVCQYVLQAAIARSDCHVTDAEVARATRESVVGTERNSYQHFWEDGLMEDGAQAAERSITRRRTLIALADALREHSPCSASDMASHPLVRGLIIEPELREFLSRKVLRGDATEGAYDFTVRLFLHWLQARGVGDVLTTFEQWDDALLQRQKEEGLRIQPAEVMELVARWGPYRGEVIQEQRVLAWLGQFGGAVEQRLMFKLLQHLQFYGTGFVRKKLQELEELVRRTVAEREGGGAVADDQILISYLDGPARSGAYFARLYTEEAHLRAQDVVERASLKERLRDGRVRAVVVVDDFVGTGSTASDGLRELHALIGDDVRSQDIKVIFCAVVAVETGWRKVQETAVELQFGVRMHCGELLGGEYSLLGEQSKVFDSAHDRARALAIVKKYGLQLEKRCPLGFGELQLCVVFERGCPNNSLPVLWSDSTKHKWKALFRRH
jgi:hypothetical protein